MRTFAVSSVELPKAVLPTVDREAQLRSMLKAPVEQLSPPGKHPLVAYDGAHPLVSAARIAFYEHYPLVLSPDAIWFCLAQGFANHVSLHAEQLRQRFVHFSGKTTLVVDRPDFFLGRDNPWPELFAAFSQQIAGHVGKLRDLIVADFSTTGPVERAASEVLLMDAFQPYFVYAACIGCGIPSITLLGTPDDWRSVRRRAAMLGELELSWWIDPLLPVLDRIVATAEGNVDRAFWQSFFHHESGSGVDELTGWLQLLFPYTLQDVPEERIEAWTEAPIDTETELEMMTGILEGKLSVEEAARKYCIRVADVEQFVWMSSPPKKQLRRNPHLVAWEAGLREATTREKGYVWAHELRGPALTAIPPGVASVPVLLEAGGQPPCTVRFVAGLFGVAQDPTSRALQPEFGWAVVHEPSAG